MTKEQKVEAYSMYLDGCTYQEIGGQIWYFTSACTPAVK